MKPTTTTLLLLGLGGCLLGWLTGPTPSWSPYQVGAGIGVLSWLTFYFTDKPIGASSFYANLAGLLGRKLAPEHTAKLKYFQEKPPKLMNWESAFILAAVVGAYLAASSAGEFNGRWLSPLWEKRFGEGTILLRFAVAFGGGIIMAFGARTAGGCTSGHGISGTMQLALSSWITVVALFVGGILTATLMYGGL